MNIHCYSDELFNKKTDLLRDNFPTFDGSPTRFLRWNIVVHCPVWISIDRTEIAFGYHGTQTRRFISYSYVLRITSYTIRFPWWIDGEFSYRSNFRVDYPMIFFHRNLVATITNTTAKNQQTRSSRSPVMILTSAVVLWGGGVVFWVKTTSDKEIIIKWIIFHISARRKCNIVTVTSGWVCRLVHMRPLISPSIRFVFVSAEKIIYIYIYI